MAPGQTLMGSSSPAALARAGAGAATSARRACPLPCLLPALLSGALLWACYHPLSWGGLAWIALVPLLSLVRSAGPPRRVLLAAWAGGLLFFVAALQWMRVADPRMFWTWFALAFYCSLYFPLAVGLTRVLDRRTRLPLVVTFPAVWVALEYLRTYALTGFPWYFLAHSQHDYLTIIQVTDLGGSYAVSVLVAAVNALAFDLLYQLAGLRAFLRLREPPDGQRTFGDDWPGLGEVALAAWRRGLLVEAVAVALLIAAACVYGSWRLGQDTVQPGPAIGLLQGNLDQRLRNAGLHHPGAQASIARHYGALCERVVARAPEVELLVWPETSFPLTWFEVDRAWHPGDAAQFELWRDLEAGARSGMHELARATQQRAHLLGIGTRRMDAAGKERLYNSALFVDGQGHAEERYDKMHRVPFGEYVPLRDWLPLMDWFAAYDFDYSIRPGEKFTRFALGKYHFGVLICYEDTDPSLARRYVADEADGPPVDFLVNISNDGWFDGSSEHETHLAVSRFRAIECRRPLVRAVNMGVSAVIDSNGRVLRPEEQFPEAGQPKLWALPYAGRRADRLPLDAWSSYKQVAGVLVAIVPVDDRFSPYTLVGDWLAGLCWLVVGAGTVGTWLYGRLRPAQGT